MRHLKLRYKLFLLVAMAGFLPLFVMSVFNVSYSTKIIQNEVYNKAGLFFDGVDVQLGEYFGRIEGDGKVLSALEDVYYGISSYNREGSSSATWFGSYNNLNESMTRAVMEYGFSDVYITNKKGKAIFVASDKMNLENKDMSGRAYVQKALAGEQNWSELFYSDVNLKNVMVLSTPVYANGYGGSVAGTINLIIDQTKLNEIIHNGIERIGTTGDAYVINSEGVLLTDTMQGELKENAALKKIVNTKAASYLKQPIEENNLDYSNHFSYRNYENKKVLGNLGVIKLGNRAAGLIIEIQEKEAFAATAGLKGVGILIFIVAIGFGVFIAVVVGRTIEVPLKKTLAYTEKIANLDLMENVDSKFLGRNDEMGDMGRGVQKVIDNLKSFAQQVTTASQKVTQTSEEFTSMSQQSAAASEEVARTIEEIARGASDQAGETESGALRANELGELIDSNKGHINSLNNASEVVNTKVKEGLEILGELINKTVESGQKTQEIMKVIELTNTSSNKIGEASGMISAIAQQTNLLALNAAIEAARAGEHGRGFAVVADEIRKLAEQSANSTKQIDDMVKELVMNSNSAVKTIEAVGGTLEEQALIVNETENKYKEIEKAIKGVYEKIDLLNVSGDSMEEKKVEIMDALQHLSAIAEENAASTEETSATTEEQSASMHEIERSSEVLSELAVDLQNSIQKFKY